MRDEELNYSISKAIRSLNPDARFSVRRRDINDCVIKWYEDTPEISKADIKTEIDRLQAEYNSQEYARLRKAEYPSIEELVVALYDTEDKLAIETKRAAIKLKYLKP